MGLYAGGMSTTHIRAAILTITATAIVGSGALSGCSISRDDETKAPSSSSASEPTTTASDEPTTEPSTPESSAPVPSESASSSPSTPPSTTPGPAATPEAALLSAAELPQLNETSPWAQGRTGTPGPDAFGLCQQFDLLSIGAITVIERTYTSGRDTAGEQVAEFPDAQNTVRARKVLQAWHRECAGQVKGTNVKVRPITDVPVPTGKGLMYLVSYERRGAGYFHSLGLVTSGNRMSLIRMDHEGQDHNYGPGRDPMELAVKAAAAKLG